MNLARNKRFKELHQLGYTIAGIDEAGRGCLAGPLVIGIVIPTKPITFSLTDSKMLTPAMREQAFHFIAKKYLWNVGIASVDEINQLGIIQAQQVATDRAISQLMSQPDYLLCDYCHYKTETPAEYLVEGDKKEKVIAAASIIAKVYRDKIMQLLHQADKRYDFNRHKGYCTKLHLDNLNQHGASPWHRVNFSPIRDLV